MLSGVVELLLSWSSNFNSKIVMPVVIWSMIPHGMWGFWQVRNALIFEGNERLINDLELSFFQLLIEWTNALGVVSFVSD